MCVHVGKCFLLDVRVHSRSTLRSPHKLGRKPVTSFPRPHPTTSVDDNQDYSFSPFSLSVSLSKVLTLIFPSMMDHFCLTFDHAFSKIVNCTHATSSILQLSSPTFLHSIPFTSMVVSYILSFFCKQMEKSRYVSRPACLKSRSISWEEGQWLSTPLAS